LFSLLTLWDETGWLPLVLDSAWDGQQRSRSCWATGLYPGLCGQRYWQHSRKL